MKSKEVERKYAKIYFRVFPMEKMIWDYVKILDDHKTIYIRYLQELAKSRENVIPTFWTFQTDQVFYNNTQQEVYECVTSEVLDNIGKKRDAIIMAYGQTGTGKTLTISGLNLRYDDRGILPRIIPDLFRLIKTLITNNNIKICVQVSYIEISGVRIVDLLKPYPNCVDSIKKIAKINVKNEDETFQLLFKGEGRKEYNEDAPYQSNCSSSIFTFYIIRKNKEMNSPYRTQCKLHIIDLAGVDTIGNLSCLFKEPHRVGSANLTKSQLGHFFLILSEDIPEHIKTKYRLNPMIQYLGDSLNRSSVLRFIGHIRVSREDLLITISMLRFGELVGGLKVSRYEMTIENKSFCEEKVTRLENELRNLKLENKYNSLVINQDLSTKSLDEERFLHIQRTVNEYLQNKITKLALINVCEINVALEILKDLYTVKCANEQNLKEMTPPKEKKSSPTRIGSNKSLRKSSHSSGGKGSSTDTMTNKNKSFEKKLPEKPQTAAGSNISKMKTSRDKVETLEKPRTASGGISKTKTISRDKVETQSDTARQKSKSSSSSLIKKRSSIARRNKSHSSAGSIFEKRDSSKVKSKSDVILILEIPPDYNDAWNSFINEKKYDYQNFVNTYEKHENCAKETYNSYLVKVKKLKEIMAEVEKCKNDVFLAKMTRQFQRVEIRDEDNNIILSDFEQHCLNELKKAENEKVKMQEIVLKCQSELKSYVNRCKDIKIELKYHFDDYCKEKYHVPVENVSGERPADEAIMNLEDAFIGEEYKQEINTKQSKEDPEMKRYCQFKKLIENEKKKKLLFKNKQRKWSNN